MAVVTDDELSAAHSRAVALAVREELARRRISRKRLADEARISISTLEKALAGQRPFTLATTIRLEAALGLSLRPKSAPAAVDAGCAPEWLGAYSHAAVAWLEGEYLTLRPSFETEGAIYAYVTEIAWDAASSRLKFREGKRLDGEYAQQGSVSLPHQSGHVYLLTNEHGQARTAILGRPAVGGEMYGLLTTLKAGRGSDLTPVAATLALVPMRKMAEPVFGVIADGTPEHGAYRRHLDRAGRDFARFFAL